MIELNGVTKKFGNDFIAVNNASFTAEDGQITGYIGPNGAGKTTSLKMITGLLKPTSGNILINGIDVYQNPLEAKKQFGYVSDSPDNFLALKGIEYLNFIADVFEVPQEQRVAFTEDVSKKLGIDHALNNPILSYSHGMRQKIMIMGALIHKPPVWILDEPLTGLDPQSAFELKNMMREHVNEGNSVLFSTHVLDTAERLCDRIVIISHGIIRFEGTLDELKARHPEGDTLEEIFLKVTGGDNE